MNRHGEIARGWFCFTCMKNHFTTAEAAACRLRALKAICTLPVEQQTAAVNYEIKVAAKDEAER